MSGSWFSGRSLEVPKKEELDKESVTRSFASEAKRMTEEYSAKVAGQAKEALSDAASGLASLDYKAEGKKRKKQLNLAKSLGIPNVVLHHSWNLFMIGLAAWIYVLYHTKVFGHYNVRRGFLMTASIMYCEIAVGMLYLISFCTGAEYIYMLTFLYKVQTMSLGTSIACTLIDTALYYSANPVFCKMQLESHKSDCAERNHLFGLQIFLFFFFFVPLWYACANATKRYARECLRPDK